MFDIHEEITLELARLQRAAFENVRKRTAEQQLGLAWVGLDQSAPRSSDRAALSERV
jgi:DNA transposition AAA+ family ATPase